MSSRTLVPFRVTLNVSRDYYPNFESLREDGLQFTHALERRSFATSVREIETRVLYTESRWGSLVHEGFYFVGESLDIASEIFGEISLALWLLEKIEETIDDHYGDLREFRIETGAPMPFSAEDYERIDLRNVFPRDLPYSKTLGAMNSGRGFVPPSAVTSRRGFQSRTEIGWNLRTIVVGVFLIFIIGDILLAITNRSDLSSRLAVAEAKLDILANQKVCETAESPPIVFDWNWTAEPDPNQSESQN